MIPPNKVINTIPDFLSKYIGINETIAEDVKNIVRDGIAARFETKTSWPSSQRTNKGRPWKKRKKEPGWPLLNRTGTMRLGGELTITRSSRFTQIIRYQNSAHDTRKQSRSYAHFHQEGTSRMPARPFLPTTNEQFYAYVMPKLREIYAAKHATLGKRIRGKGSKRFFFKGT